MSSIASSTSSPLIQQDLCSLSLRDAVEAVVQASRGYCDAGENLSRALIRLQCPADCFMTMINSCLDCQQAPELQDYRLVPSLLSFRHGAAAGDLSDSVSRILARLIHIESPEDEKFQTRDLLTDIHSLPLNLTQNPRTTAALTLLSFWWFAIPEQKRPDLTPTLSPLLSLEAEPRYRLQLATLFLVRLKSRTSSTKTVAHCSLF